MAPVGFEPTISAGERPQTYALDRAATGTGMSLPYLSEIVSKLLSKQLESLSSLLHTTQM